MTTVKPLADYLLIEPLQKETTLPSGIVIPDTVKEKPQEGKVIATGPGRKDDKGTLVAVGVNVSDIVMYKKWGGNEVKIDGREMTLVSQEDVLAIVS